MLSTSLKLAVIAFNKMERQLPQATAFHYFHFQKNNYNVGPPPLPSIIG